MASSGWTATPRRTKVLVVAFAVLAVGGILFPAFTNYLFGGDRRIYVVTMEQGAGQQAREAVKAACGGLPGVEVIADRGNPDPRIQGRFPVRFSISGATPQQEAALTACLNEQDGVRGFLQQRG